MLTMHHIILYNVIKYFDTIKIEGIEECEEGRIAEMESYPYTPYSEDQMYDNFDLEKPGSNAQKLFAGLKIKDNENESNESITTINIYIKMEFCDYDLNVILCKIKDHKTNCLEEGNFRFINSLLEFRELKENNLGIFCPLNIFVQISNGLKFIHENSIVHRDLKPSNIFVTKRFEFMASMPIKAGDEILYNYNYKDI